MADSKNRTDSKKENKNESNKLDMDALRARAAAAEAATTGRTIRVRCPNCHTRSFNCIKPSSNCWCLKVERNFDFTELVKQRGALACVCPVCLTGREDAREEAEPAGD